MATSSSSSAAGLSQPADSNFRSASPSAPARRGTKPSILAVRPPSADSHAHPATLLARRNNVQVHYVHSLPEPGERAGFDFRFEASGFRICVWWLPMKALRADPAGCRKRLEAKPGGGGTTSAGGALKKFVLLDLGADGGGSSAVKGGAVKGGAKNGQKKTNWNQGSQQLHLHQGRAMEQALQDFSLEVIFSPSWQLLVLRNAHEAALAIEEMLFVATVGPGRVLGVPRRVVKNVVQKKNTKNLEGASAAAAAGVKLKTAAVEGTSFRGCKKATTEELSPGSHAASRGNLDNGVAKPDSSTAAADGDADAVVENPSEDGAEDAIDIAEEEHCREAAIDILMLCKDVSREDATTLLEHFGSLAKVLQQTGANAGALTEIPGFGDRKSRNFNELFHSRILAD